MKLKHLLKPLKSYELYGCIDVDVKSLVDNSRKVKKGCMFVAIKGENFDGHDYIEKAFETGAIVIIGEKPGVKNKNGAVYVRVSNTREALGLMASAWYDYPCLRLKIIGVTGTDGKTTTANLIYHLLTKSGRKTGLISSISAKIAGKVYDTGFHVTSPEPIALHKFLRLMADGGCKYAVLEVTSHGLHQKRVAGINFDIAVLTNITHEHTDYHGGWEEYRDVKAELFKDVNTAVLNKDDKSYRFIAGKLKKNTKLLTYSLKDKNADIFAGDIADHVGYTDFYVLYDKKRLPVMFKLPGDYNIANYLGAFGAGMGAGLEAQNIVDKLKNFEGLKGRLEEVKNNKSLEIFIDFAHTPNSLENVLKMLKNRKKGRLISIFGCAGERDRDKREKMGKISVKYSDISVFTAEDPRSEDVNSIIKMMQKGAEKYGAREVKPAYFNKSTYQKGKGRKTNLFINVPERGKAIWLAVNKIAQNKDIIVISGKGHENSMAYNGREHSWSDHKAVKKALKGEILQINK